MLSQYVGILDLGTPSLILILLMVLLLFGGKKLPELARSIGASVRELRKEIGEGNSDDKKDKQDSEKAKQESSS